MTDQKETAADQLCDLPAAAREPVYGNSGSILPGGSPDLELAP